MAVFSEMRISWCQQTRMLDSKVESIFFGWNSKILRASEEWRITTTEGRPAGLFSDINFSVISSGYYVIRNVDFLAYLWETFVYFILFLITKKNPSLCWKNRPFFIQKRNSQKNKIGFSWIWDERPKWKHYRWKLLEKLHRLAVSFMT